MTLDISYDYYLHFAVEGTTAQRYFKHCGQDTLVSNGRAGMQTRELCSGTSSEPSCPDASLPRGQYAKEREDRPKGNTSKRIQEPHGQGQDPVK